MESVLIEKPAFDKPDSSLPLELFWYNRWYDAHLSHGAYSVVFCSVFSITLRVLVFCQKPKQI